MTAKSYKVLLQDTHASQTPLLITTEDFKKEAVEMARFLQNAVPCKVLDIIFERIAVSAGYDDCLLPEFITNVWMTIDEISRGA
jgi:hypothetical protein